MGIHHKQDSEGTRGPPAPSPAPPGARGTLACHEWRAFRLDVMGFSAWFGFSGSFVSPLLKAGGDEMCFQLYETPVLKSHPTHTDTSAHARVRTHTHSSSNVSFPDVQLRGACELASARVGEAPGQARPTLLSYLSRRPCPGALIRPSLGKPGGRCPAQHHSLGLREPAAVGDAVPARGVLGLPSFCMHARSLSSRLDTLLCSSS